MVGFPTRPKSPEKSQALDLGRTQPKSLRQPPWGNYVVQEAKSVLSKQLKPPVNWSYRKLIRVWVLVSFSIGWILFYIMQSIFSLAARRQRT